ncbi:hypothetical protein ACJD0Z_12585 [Flavobacteriaceae bacterium M23B6Z8]
MESFKADRNEDPKFKTYASIASCDESVYQHILPISASRKNDSPWKQMFPKGWNKKIIDALIISLLAKKDAKLIITAAKEQQGFIIGHAFTDLLKDLHIEDHARFSKVYLQLYVITHKEKKGNAFSELHQELVKHAKEKGYNTMISRTPEVNHSGIRALTKCGFTDKLLIDDSSTPKRVYLAKKIQTDSF